MKEMVGEVVLRWAINQSGSGEFFEAWKKKIDELDGYGTILSTLIDNADGTQAY